MKNINQYLKEKFQDTDFLRDYYREATTSRLADQLLLLRKARGLTQKDLAEKMGTTQTVISRLENASVRPSLETILKAAQAMDAVVDVRIVPLEELNPDQNQIAAESDEDEVFKKPNGEMVKYFRVIEDNLKEQARPVIFDMNARSWSISSRPSMQPVYPKERTPEFA